MKRYLVILAILGLAACAGDAATRATNSLAISCDTYATLLDQINPLIAKGTVPLPAAERVAATNKLVAKACSKEERVAEPAEVIGVVNSGIDLLKSVKGAF